MRKKRKWTTSYVPVLAALMAVSTVCGQEVDAGNSEPKPIVCPPSQCGPEQSPQMPATLGYNAPAEINAGCQGDLDFFGSASYLYWQSWVDNLAFAFVNNNPLSETVTPGIQGEYKEMTFRFRPGFKVGLGANLERDDWDGYTEYTRFRGNHTASTDGNGSPANLAPIYATIGNSFLQNLFTNGGGAYSTAASRYRNDLDFVDAEIGRTYYVGKQLVFHPAFGARAAWILQSLHVDYNYPAVNPFMDDQSIIFSSTRTDVNIYQRVHSWGIGPRIGLEMDWMAGYGIRIMGSGYLDILYTRYHLQDKTAVIQLAQNPSILVRPGTVTTHTDKERMWALRTHLDMEMGFGWGRYLLANDWHVDLSATYGWQIFFDQNMLRKFWDRAILNSYKNPISSLYVQGLTLTARLDY
jgi:Legionella pneumophila major outer membrane protein precursor